MKTKEVIEFLTNMANSFKCISSLNIKDINNKTEEVITLLQQGEVYKKMWEELYEIASEFNFFPMMDKIKQKYLKEVKD